MISTSISTSEFKFSLGADATGVGRAAAFYESHWQLGQCWRSFATGQCVFVCLSLLPVLQVVK